MDSHKKKHTKHQLKSNFSRDNKNMVKIEIKLKIVFQMKLIFNSKRRQFK